MYSVVVEHDVQVMVCVAPLRYVVSVMGQSSVIHVSVSVPSSVGGSVSG